MNKLRNLVVVAGLSLAGNTGCGTAINTMHTRNAHEIGSRAEEYKTSGLESIYGICKTTNTDLAKCVLSKPALSTDFALSFLEKFRTNDKLLPREFSLEKITEKLKKLELEGMKFEYQGDKDKKIIKIVIKGVEVKLSQPIDIDFAPSFFEVFNLLLEQLDENEIVTGSAEMLNAGLLKITLKNKKTGKLMENFISEWDFGFKANPYGDGKVRKFNDSSFDITLPETPEDHDKINSLSVDQQKAELLTVIDGKIRFIRKIKLSAGQRPTYETVDKTSDKIESYSHFRYGELKINLISVTNSREITRLDQLVKADNVQSGKIITEIYLNDTSRPGFLHLYFDKTGQKIHHRDSFVLEGEGVDLLETQTDDYFGTDSEKPVLSKVRRAYLSESNKDIFRKQIAAASNSGPKLLAAYNGMRLANQRDNKFIIRNNQGELGDFKSEKAKNPNLKVRDWMKQLAGKMDSIWHWSYFNGLFYYDDETVVREDKTVLIRQPEDIFENNLKPNYGELPFIFKDLLELQGVKSHIVNIPKFGFTTFWIVNNADGSFDVNYYHPLIGVGKNGAFALAKDAQPIFDAKSYKSHLEALKDGFRVVFPDKDKTARDQDAESKYFLWKTFSGKLPVVKLNEKRIPINEMVGINEIIN